MSESAWESVFGFEEPYANQADAIETAIEVGKRRGFLAMEGPCGTGKTMAALTAGATLVRETSRFERVLVVTPVKQQLQQFVEDLRAMNDDLDEPMNGVSLVGKRDLCPYGREGVFPRDASTHERCDDLRENTAALVEGREGSTRGTPTGEATAALRPEDALEDAWWDAGTARRLARDARHDDPETLSGALATAGAESPYVRHQPSAPDEVSDEDALYCPFEADWYGREKGSPLGFDAGENHVVTVDELLPGAVEYGTCPHRAQSVLLEHADVIVGNYNHLFDPGTRPLLEGLLDEGTFVVVDEAHRMEERVRDLLSDRIGRHTLVRARNDFQTLLQYARQSHENEREFDQKLADYGATLDAVEDAKNLVDDVVGWLDDRVESHLSTEYGTLDPDRLPERDLEIPLRDPETNEVDDLTEWGEESGYTGGVWRSLGDVGSAVEAVLNEGDNDRQCVCTAVGQLLGAWWERDHVSFFREIELEHAPADAGSVSRTYEAAYTPALVTYNCMPGDQIRGVLEEVGGGVLMSATLEPIDVFREVVGLDALESGDDRPVVERTYDMVFPESNRASYVVDAAPFTRSNRGEPGEPTRTRDQYEYVLRTVARSPGNVLVCMPNYREAAWAGEYLADAVEKEVLVDSSSSNEATDDLKAEFFAGPGKVLATSTRGTLTEGVDYDGEKLAACLVVGIPLVNIGSPRVRAVRHAYGDAFGEERAFEYALTVPAVRRSRQAIGRVIRGRDEVGVRVLAGRRYVEGARHSVHEYLSPEERAEFVRMTPEFLGDQLGAFWRDHK
ncbi:ATP-dependent DNA helicase [Salarchaeum sp. JOR-1]|uniref:ATP-dependent DNA helicase n=1 Tax=Salarchaeum sp. JOR-1 TaxID=2599399 RepID=UPI0011986F1C|nr:ATP-dependent DNA helicase [Salarchaeum sp. JOR-1]QDX40867.1 ATP-dependent DNA helicase [Salarchaeum sp. JOR-1]